MDIFDQFYPKLLSLHILYHLSNIDRGSNYLGGIVHLISQMIVVEVSLSTELRMI